MERVSKKRHNGPMSEVWRKLKRNKFAMVSLVAIVLLLFIAIFAPFIIPYDYSVQDYDAVLEFPSWSHPFGTDNFGRDVLSRIIYVILYLSGLVAQSFPWRSALRWG